MIKLSEYFWDYEVTCKCGCGFNQISRGVLLLADEVREYINKPITPSSACRCWGHNKKVGGSKNSYHLLGQALDLPVPDPTDVYKYLDAKYPDSLGLGLYVDDGFVHVDDRANRARWFG